MQLEEVVKIIKTSNKEVIIYCAAALGEFAYALLLEFDIHIACFCDKDLKRGGSRVLDTPVLQYEECREKFPESIYIISNEEYYKSSIIAKHLETAGYTFEKNYFLFQEINWCVNKYVPFKKAFQNKEIILQGDQYLCDMMQQWLVSTLHFCQDHLHYCVNDNNIEKLLMNYSEAIWIILDKPKINEKKRDIWTFLHKYKIKNYCLYFFSNYIYCNAILNKKETIVSHEKNTIAEKINKVIFLVDSGCSGSFFIQSLLDSHPNILYFGWNILTFDIWRYVTLASKQEVENIIFFICELLVKDYTEMKESMPEDMEHIINSVEFKDRFFHYVGDKKRLKEREIFIYLSLSYYEASHGLYSAPIVPVIYVDIHTDVKQQQETGLRWLRNMEMEVILLKMIRNPIIRLGSYFKFQVAQRGEIRAKKVYDWFKRCGEEKKFEIYDNVKVCKIRFEDLKLEPKEVMMKFCALIGIPWDDILLETTSGKEKSIYNYSKERITGFDLKPVYYQYDEFFSSFDKFRLDILFGVKAKAYGYTFLNRTFYGFKEDQILMYFEIPFHFEKYIIFKDEEEKRLFRVNLYYTCKFLLYRIWNIDEYSEDFDFSQYL